MHKVTNTEKIPVFLPLLDANTLKHLDDTLKIGWLGMGSNTKEFEDLISEYLDLDGRHVVATNTATSALHLALRINKIGQGDEVITPSFNCVADQPHQHDLEDFEYCTDP